jgi:serine protease AprX
MRNRSFFLSVFAVALLFLIAALAGMSPIQRAMGADDGAYTAAHAVDFSATKYSIGATQFASQPDAEPSHVTTPLSEHLRVELAASEGAVSFLAILTDQPEPATLAATALAVAEIEAGKDDPATLRRAVYRYLTDEAQRTQASLRAWLDAQGIAYRAFYLVNMLEIEGDAALVEALRARPEIARLVANPLIDEGAHLFVEMPKPEQMAQDSTLVMLVGRDDPDDVRAIATLTDPPQTGIDYTRAPLVWALGYRGQGIVIANGDTGVEWEHPSLKPKYRGWNAQAETVSHDYHWLDAWRAEDQAAPGAEQSRCVNATGACDDLGHGTHTAGTLVGDPDPAGPRQIGMAPDAQWIGCRNMLKNFGTPAKYTACFEFFLAPYPQGGDPMRDGNPELGAHIVNNSWGCPPSEGCDVDSLRQVIETVKAAGMFVAASAGNSGPSCSSVNTPPGHHGASFSVGAHNLEGTIAAFSSRGPVMADGSGRLKPNLTAPGVAIHSAHLSGNYVASSGTSMASPHVAGAVALIWSAVPALQGDVVTTEEILVKSATPVHNNSCNPDELPDSPNNTYGFGRLDAYRAVSMALSPWEVGIRVRGPDNALLASIRVELEDELTGRRYTATTGQDGWARWSVVYNGVYNCFVGLPAPGVGATQISRVPQFLLPEEPDGESLVIQSCQMLGLYVPLAQRD